MRKYRTGTVRRSLTGRRLWLLCSSALCCYTPAALAQSSTTETGKSQASEQVDPSGGEIIVTARRQAETVMTVPESITAFGEQTLSRLGIQNFEDYATKVPNLAFSYGSSGYGFVGSKTIAIRGISGAGTTAYYIDDTPVPENLDPQVVDIARIEVLKGPRGTLYGQGSLGGNVKLVTNRPSLSDNEMRFSAEGGFTKNGGSADYTANVVGNMVLVPDKIGLRVVGFTNHQAGFYDRVYPGPTGSVLTGPVERQGDQGASTAYGGSISARFKLSDEFTADLRLMGQDQKYKGYPAIDAPLPRFKPVALEQVFAADIQDRSRDSWFLPSLELNYATDAVTLTSSTSFFSRSSGVTEEGTQQTNDLMPLFYDDPAKEPVPRYTAQNPNVWYSNNKETSFNQEFRASFTGNKWISGVIGVRYAKTTNKSELISTELIGLAASGYWPNDIWAAFKTRQNNKDISIFGETYLHYAGFELTLGIRKYWLKQHTPYSLPEGFSFGPEDLRTYNLRSSASGLNPKVALSYKLPGEGLVYASASKGFRAGGPNGPVNAPCDPGLAQLGLTRADVAQVKPDTVWNYEVGAKHRIGRLTATAAVFQMDWKDIQQTVVIPICQTPRQLNAGAARSRGIELELEGQLFRGFDVRFGFGYNDAKITEQGISPRPVGSRLFNVPKFTVSAAGDYNWSISDALDAFVGADYSYIDKSLSGVVEAERPSYQIVNARLGVRRGQLEIGFYARNLFNEFANLGDLSNLSFGKFDANGQIIPRVVILQPRQLGMTFKYGF
jgi:iron complex outermembrane recepter protein